MPLVVLFLWVVDVTTAVLTSPLREGAIRGPETVLMVAIPGAVC